MKQKGFTLIELMVVAAIIALLTSIVLTSLGTAKSKGRDTERIQEIKALQTALELYQLDFGYPSIEGGIAKIDTSGNSEGDENMSNALADLVENNFISEIPRPPKGGIPGEFYYYQTSSEDNGYMCSGKAAGNGVPYIIYFTTELPKSFNLLTDSEGTPVSNGGYYTYCFTL